MIKLRLVGLVYPNTETRVLTAAAWLYARHQTVTARTIDYRTQIPRRRVEKALVALEADGLIRFHPGRPRSIEPLVGIVAWDEPNVGPMGRTRWADIVRRRSGQRTARVCRHPLITRLGRLCWRCGEVLDERSPTDVSSTAV